MEADRFVAKLALAKRRILYNGVGIVKKTLIWPFFLCPTFLIVIT
jgi:hypothetical protein